MGLITANSQFSLIFWIAVAVIFVLLTVFKRGIVAPGFAAGAVLACFAAFKEADRGMQLSIFVIASVVLIALAKRIAERRRQK